MQSLDVHNPGLPDLQYVLMVVALCTSDLPTLNLSEEARQTVFNRCWALLHNTPPPTDTGKRVLDLRHGDEVTLEALVQVIRNTFTEYGCSRLTWDHAPSEPTQTTSPDAHPLIERLQNWDPVNPPPVDGSTEAENN